jgi:hypothetical protein
MVCADSWDKIFGWAFDELQITVQRYHCEDLYASGRAAEATEALLNILDTFGEEIRANKATADWVMGVYRHLNRMDMDNAYI